MSLFCSYPPTKANCVDKNGLMTPAWRSFVDGLYQTYGGPGGSLSISGDYIISTKLHGSIRINSNSLFFNDLTFPDSQDIDETSLFIASDSSTLSVITPQEIGLVHTTGDTKLSYRVTASTGWLKVDDGTIGDASSGATSRANADTQDLFYLLWTSVSNTYAPVSGGRGASAAADWAAHKTIALTKSLGRILGFAGAGSGLTSRALGSYAGENSHAITLAEYPAHQHTTPVTVMNGPTVTGPAYYLDFNNSSAGNSYLSDSSGSGTAHNNMGPTNFMNLFIKL